MKSENKYLGPNVHQDTVVVAVADGARSAEMVPPRSTGVARTIPGPAPRGASGRPFGLKQSSPSRSTGTDAAEKPTPSGWFLLFVYGRGGSITLTLERLKTVWWPSRKSMYPGFFVLAVVEFGLLHGLLPGDRQPARRTAVRAKP